MAAVKLTKRVVEAAKPSAKDIILGDNELKGFGCKITPKGTRRGRSVTPDYEHGGAVLENSVTAPPPPDFGGGGSELTDPRFTPRSSSNPKPI